MTRRRAYPIPAVPDPGEYYCVRFYIPKDSLYLGAFWQSVHYLSSPLAWENDAEHTALIAAQVWKDAIQKSQEIDACGKGDCGIMDVRQSETPCLLEKKIDCGDWEQFADMRLCVPKMRIAGGIIQQDVTGNGDWQDANTIPYDPRTDAPITPPWADPPPGEDGQCLSAINVATYIDYVAYNFADSMVQILSFFETLSGAITILTAIMDLIPLALLTAVIIDLYVQVVDDWEDVRDESVISKLTDILACRYSADGSITKDNWIIVIEDINAYRDTLSDNDERAKWWIVAALVGLWGNVGMSIVGAIWGITTYSCDYDECNDWTHVFDFRASDGGFTVEGSSGWGGEWVEGTGWVGTAQEGVGRALSIIKTISENEAVCHTVRVYIKYTSGLTNRWDILSGDEGAIHLWTNGSYEPVTDFEWQRWDGIVTDARYINLNPSKGGGDTSGQIIIQQLEISGTGDDPWA
jgi:hypothetical protein